MTNEPRVTDVTITNDKWGRRTTITIDTDYEPDTPPVVATDMPTGMRIALLLWLSNADLGAASVNQTPGGGHIAQPRPAPKPPCNG